MTALLVKYNKVTNAAFAKLLGKQADKLILRWADINHFQQNKMDVLDYPLVNFALDIFAFKFDAIIIGDIFWPTGQNICRWCLEHGIRCYFLQHGQWIYFKNKVDPKYLPTATCFVGDDIANACSEWPYADRSRLAVTGNPRYDNSVISTEGDYVYFAPPVILERVPSSDDKHNPELLKTIQRLKGLDKQVKLVIHPHYREGNVLALRNIFPEAEFRDPQDDPLPIVAGASKVLTHRNSTTVLDAIAHGKITVLMNFEKEDWSVYNKEYFGDFALESETPHQCFDNVISDEVLDLDDYIERARRYVYLGDASQRVVDELYF